MADFAICNASPLIFLARGRHLPLLAHFYSSVLLPIPVADELAARGPEDETVRTLQQTTWLQTAPAEHVPDSVASWGLGPGESAVVALALVTPGCEALIDDLAGRRCAASLGVPVRGTLGIVLLAKKRGIVPAARPVLEELIEGGMYLSRHVLDEALRRVGE